MKAITVLQPYASLLAEEKKRYETRSWATNYRGPIAIHAGKSMEYYGLEHEEPFLTALKDEILTMADVGGPVEADWDEVRADLPYGAIIAVAYLVECWKIDGYGHDLGWQPGINDLKSKFYYAHPAKIVYPAPGDFIRIRYPETVFGYYPDCGFIKEPRFAWEIANVRRIEPIPAKGFQRIWNWDAPPEIEHGGKRI